MGLGAPNNGAPGPMSSNQESLVPLRPDWYQARGTTGEPLVYKPVVNFLMLKLDITCPCQLALAGWSAPAHQ